jgi:hypothetical protein
MKKISANKRILKITQVNVNSYSPFNKKLISKNEQNYSMLREQINYPNTLPIINVSNEKISIRENIKIAIILNLYYEDTPNDFFNRLLELKKVINFDLYVNFVKNSPADKNENINIFKKLNSTIFKFENIGKDIYPKLNIIKHIYDTNISYDYVFLMHDKKSNQYDKKLSKWMISWESDLTSILFDNNLRNFSINLLETNNNVGMIGSKKHLHFGPGWHYKMNKNRYYNESELIKHYNNIKKAIIINKKNIQANWFIGGTMFWVRWDCLTNFYKHIDFNSISLKFKNDVGDVRDPSFTHAFERFFGYIVESDDKKVIGI